jgi:type IV pilus assembly protein PilM
MYVTLNINASSIRLLYIRGKKVEKWGSAPLAPGLVRDGLIVQPKAVGATIDALFKSMKVPKERVITSLTGVSFTYRILSLPRMRPVLLEEAIRRGAKKEMPLPPEDLYLSWQAIGSEHDELNFFVLGVPRTLADALVQTLAEAGIKPYLMDLKPLALARAANREDAIIVALEPDSFDIVLVANGIPAIMHAMTLQGEGASLEDKIRRLTDELSKTVEFYNGSHQQNPLAPTTPLLLAGELAADATTSQLIQAEIQYPVEPLVPPLESPPELPTALYATNMGLALKKVPKKMSAHFHDINVNILSGKYRVKAPPLPRRTILVCLVLIIAIGFLFPLQQAKSQAGAEVTHLQTELSGISQELRQARLAANEAEQVETNINEIATEVEMVKQEHQYLQNTSRNFAGNLELVTNAIPSGAYFTSIQIGTDQITVEGEADSSFTVVSYAMALEAQWGLSEVRISAIDKTEVAKAEAAETEGSGVTFVIIITK